MPDPGRATSNRVREAAFTAYAWTVYALIGVPFTAWVRLRPIISVSVEWGSISLFRQALKRDRAFIRGRIEAKDYRR